MATRVDIPFVDLAAQQRSIVGGLEEALRGTMQRTDWVLGDEVRAFEEEFADFCEVAHCVGVDRALRARALLRAYDIGPGDEVITRLIPSSQRRSQSRHTGATARLSSTPMPRIYASTPT